MAAQFNTTAAQAHGPEMILSSVNVYLDQYEPLYLVFVAVSVITLLYTIVPRLKTLMTALVLSLVCVEFFRAYQRDVDSLNEASAFWYSVGGSILTAAFTYSLAKIFF